MEFCKKYNLSICFQRKKKSCLLTYILTFISFYVYLYLRWLVSLSATSTFDSSMSLSEPSISNGQSRSWRSRKAQLLSSGFSNFSSLKLGCHIFSVIFCGMVQSPFEWGNQINRGKTSGELANKLWDKEVAIVFVTPLMQMSSCSNASILGMQTQTMMFLQVWKKVLFCSCSRTEA